eukprot:7296310-Alexandrium_andersonii.AAC.1
MASQETYDGCIKDAAAHGQNGNQDDHHAPCDAVGRPVAAITSSAHCPSATPLRQKKEACCNAART